MMKPMAPELVRHFSVMALDLTRGAIEEPALPDGFAFEPMTIEALPAYGLLVTRAFAGDHVDHQPEDEDPALAAQALERSLRGEDVGPWLPEASAHIRCDDGSIVGAIVTCERLDDEGRPDRPWISDVFVDPSFAGRGLGSALIWRAANQLAGAGHTRLGLAVTHGNPAVRAYERIGFRIQREVKRFRPTVRSGEAHDDAPPPPAPFRS